ncbi:flavin reductase [Aliihoeflea aestuarii]|jgi:flavin reductase (DIM6/NTAB) family NADH-FMN oxidoreductase RutF|nr:flavin reductase [Aliihoeflea aestuarii]
MEVVMSRHETVFVPEPANQRSLRTALGSFTTGVAVVTATTDDGPIGMTANSFASVSLDPPLVLWSPAKSSRRHTPFVTAQHYAIHVLGADQHDIGERFVYRASDFSGLDWFENDEGVPLIAGALARFECARWTVHDGGDHSIVIGRVLRAAHREGEPLCFSRGSFGSFAGKG